MGIEKGQWTGITPVITIMEIIVHPLQLGYNEVA
jgi:hypothetical protein